MNVGTSYQTEQFMQAIGEPCESRNGRPERNVMHDLKVREELWAEETADIHAQKHAANMAAWRYLHAEHIEAGRLDIADCIMQTKIIPDIA